MKRRELILLLGGASSGAMSVGTGAFSSVEAERNVEVDVVEDENAYLGLEQVADSVTVGEKTDIIKIQNQFASSLSLSVVPDEVDNEVSKIGVRDGNQEDDESDGEIVLSLGSEAHIFVECHESGDDISFTLEFIGDAGGASVDKTRTFKGLEAKGAGDRNNGNGGKSGTNNGNGGE
jgi:hypothetical protein